MLLWVEAILESAGFTLAVGLAGMLFIITGWAISLKDIPPLRLSLLYGAGSLLLTIYSVLLGDFVFTALNASATGLAIANTYRAIRQKRRYS